MTNIVNNIINKQVHDANTEINKSLLGQLHTKLMERKGDVQAAFYSMMSVKK